MERGRGKAYFYYFFWVVGWETLDVYEYVSVTFYFYPAAPVMCQPLFLHILALARKLPSQERGGGIRFCSYATHRNAPHSFHLSPSENCAPPPFESMYTVGCQQLYNNVTAPLRPPRADAELTVERQARLFHSCFTRTSHEVSASAARQSSVRPCRVHYTFSSLFHCRKIYLVSCPGLPPET
jgi:hypothetical protein